jgi:hypothetical protein
VRWTWINESFSVLARHGVPTEVVRYESFVRNPHEEVRRIAAFAGVKMDAAIPDTRGGNRVQMPEDHLVAGNRMRFVQGEIELRVDDEWKTELSAGQRRTVEGVTWPLLRRYGYGTWDPSED